MVAEAVSLLERAELDTDWMGWLTAASAFLGREPEYADDEGDTELVGDVQAGVGGRGGRVLFGTEPAVATQGVTVVSGVKESVTEPAVATQSVTVVSGVTSVVAKPAVTSQSITEDSGVTPGVTVQDAVQFPGFASSFETVAATPGGAAALQQPWRAAEERRLPETRAQGLRAQASSYVVPAKARAALRSGEARSHPSSLPPMSRAAAAGEPPRALISPSASVGSLSFAGLAAPQGTGGARPQGRGSSHRARTPWRTLCRGRVYAPTAGQISTP